MYAHKSVECVDVNVLACDTLVERNVQTGIVRQAFYQVTCKVYK